MNGVTPNAGKQVVAALGRNTEFVYMYRDASNWKKLGRVVFKGLSTLGDAGATRMLFSAADNGVYFIPEQVGLSPTLDTDFSRHYPAEDDHGWHEVIRLEETDRAPTDLRTIDEFIGEFTAAKWNPAKSSVMGSCDPRQEKRGAYDWILEI